MNTMTTIYDFSPQSVAQQAEALLTRLRALAAEKQQNLYLLIDWEALPEDVMHPFITALVEQRPVPVKLPHHKLTADRQPWLIKLNLLQPAHHTLLALSTRHALEEQHPDRLCNGGGRAVCGWLTSPYDTNDVAKQLGHTAIQSLVSGQQILLRYYDPAIHGILWPQLNDLQHERWLGVLSGWHYLDGDGQLVSHCHSPSAYPYMTFSLMVSPEDEIHISQTGKIVSVLERYRQAQINQSRHDDITAITIVREALLRAQHLHGFDNDIDQQALALDCLRLHPRLDTHPRMQILLSPRERESETDYAACVAALSVRDWQAICLNLDAADAGDRI